MVAFFIDGSDVFFGLTIAYALCYKSKSRFHTR